MNVPETNYIPKNTAQKAALSPGIAPAAVSTATPRRAAAPCPASGFYPRDASVSDVFQNLRVDFTKRKK